eukprot:CAMPEP_0177643600 /NCGR_PEP_ID=MMETSP0447-20121125/8237_1 /TAXON_ID=0 /ORGANISM="Stygamoeba regulata, Strain BSH-02190019" /LENGTH=398 /DNA_ID=CAMNT_0019145897 /DNA_START=122 /DNA_END=1318 /DNA_ORIENTATION=-
MHTLPRAALTASLRAAVGAGVRAKHGSAGTRPIPHTQRAACVQEYGAPLKVRTLPVPSLARGDVLVQVEAASVNVLDGMMANGYGRRLFEAKRPLPFVPGRDCAGVVRAVGSGVMKFKVGDHVYGVQDPFLPGTFSEYVALSEMELAPKPAALSFDEAACLPFVASTALPYLSVLSPGAQTVVVVGGSGAIGGLLIQAIKILHPSITVITTCRADVAEAVKVATGADVVVPRCDDTFPHADVADALAHHSASQLADAVFDTSPYGANENALLALVARGGAYVVFNSPLVSSGDAMGLAVGFPTALASLAAKALRLRLQRGIAYHWGFFQPAAPHAATLCRLSDLVAAAGHQDEPCPGSSASPTLRIPVKACVPLSDAASILPAAALPGVGKVVVQCRR